MFSHFKWRLELSVVGPGTILDCGDTKRCGLYNGRVIAEFRMMIATMSRNHHWSMSGLSLEFGSPRPSTSSPTYRIGIFLYTATLIPGITHTVEVSTRIIQHSVYQLQIGLPYQARIIWTMLHVPLSISSTRRSLPRSPPLVPWSLVF